MRPERSVITTESAVCSTALVSRSVCSSARLRAVTSRSTATAPSSSPASLYHGVPLTLIHAQSAVPGVRTQISTSVTVSPSRARVSGRAPAG